MIEPRITQMDHPGIGGTVTFSGGGLRTYSVGAKVMTFTQKLNLDLKAHRSPVAKVIYALNLNLVLSKIVLYILNLVLNLPEGRCVTIGWHF